MGEANEAIDGTVSDSGSTVDDDEQSMDRTIPTADVRTELEVWLSNDESRVGEVYRLTGQGYAPAEIAHELEVSTYTFVYSAKRIIACLLEGKVPTKPSVADAVARKIRSILKSPALSDPSRAYLRHLHGEVDKWANNEAARDVEFEEASKETKDAESKNTVGIYVYALPHYITHRYDADTGRTLMKVGHSANDVIERFRSQTRTTALPEEPLLLRIYTTAGDADASKKAERVFHRLLEAADHYRSVARSAGKEWFTTSTRFLDEVARVMKLEIIEVSSAR